MSHTLVNLSSCKLYECVMSYVRMRLCQTHEWVMSHIWMSHVTYEWAMSHMKWSSNTHDCVISHVNEPYHTWMRPVTYEKYPYSSFLELKWFGKRAFPVFGVVLILKAQISVVQNISCIILKNLVVQICCLFYFSLSGPWSTQDSQ